MSEQFERMLLREIDEKDPSEINVFLIEYIAILLFDKRSNVVAETVSTRRWQ